MRRALVLLALLLFAGAAFAQPAQLAPCLVSGTDCAAASGAVTGALTSGRVTLSTGATTVGDDAGCTWTGTGALFTLTASNMLSDYLGVGVLLFPKANNVADFGNNTHVWRTGYFGTSVVTPVVQLTLATPTTSGDTCVAGTFWADASFLYVCTATNTIKRAALSAF